MKAVLATASVAAGAIHLELVPSHASEWMAQGVAFAIVGWLQVLSAIAVLLRPSRLLMQAMVVLNTAAMVAWVWVHTAGPPVGPEEGIRHPSGLVDVTCVLLEAAVVVAALVGWFRPGIGSRLGERSKVVLSIVPIAVLVFATVVMVSPSATANDHHDHGGTAGEGVASDEHSHEGADAEVAADGHDHGSVGDAGLSTDDKGLSALANGEMVHVYGPDQPLDSTTQAALNHQLSLTRLITDRFPTVRDARDAGSTPQGGFGPGLGLHMAMPRVDIPLPDSMANGPTISGTLGVAELMHPASIMYAGSSDDAPVAGVMYTTLSIEEPEGFAGPNDHWHSHGNLCLSFSAEGIRPIHPDDKSEAGCSAIGGRWIAQTTYMVHVWTVPGYESNRGVFSDVNPAIACTDGTYYTIDASDNDRYPLNKCLADAA